jgi:hypothetical protein
MRVLTSLMLLVIVVVPSRRATAQPLHLCCPENGACQVRTDAKCNEGEKLLATDLVWVGKPPAQDIPYDLVLWIAVAAAVAYIVRAIADYKTAKQQANAKSAEDLTVKFLKSLSPGSGDSELQRTLEALAKQLSAPSASLQRGLHDLRDELARLAHSLDALAKSRRH